jgi:hypothetical protein
MGGCKLLGKLAGKLPRQAKSGKECHFERGTRSFTMLGRDLGFDE